MWPGADPFMRGIRFLNREIANVHAAALLVGAAGLASRALGVMRDRLLAGHFGAGRELDIYVAAFQIPDFLFTLFLLGAASAAIIPVLTATEEKSPAAARRFVEELGTLFVVVSCLTAIAAFYAAPAIAALVTPGFSGGDRVLVVILTRIMLVSPILLGLSNIISSVLQAHRRFLAYALSSVFYNLGIIIGILFFLPRWGLSGLGLGVVLGALLHAAVQAPTLWSLGFSVPFSVTGLRSVFSLSPALRRVLVLSVPRVIAISATNIAGIALIAIASTLASGSIVMYRFADNLRFVPIGLFGVSFAVAAFPGLSLAGAGGHHKKFLDLFRGTARSVLFWVLPLSVLFYVLRAQIVRVALGAGRFDWQDTRLTAALLGVLAVVIVTDSLSVLAVRSFYALGNTRTPFFINCATAAATIAAAFSLAYLFRDPGNPLLRMMTQVLRIEDVAGSAVLGVAGAAALGSVADCLLLMYALFRRLPARTGSWFREDLGELAVMTGAALASGAAAYGALRMITIWITLERFSGVLIQGAGAGIVGSTVYAVLLWCLGNREIREIADAAHRRMFTRANLPQELPQKEIV